MQLTNAQENLDFLKDDSKAYYKHMTVDKGWLACNGAMTMQGRERQRLGCGWSKLGERAAMGIGERTWA